MDESEVYHASGMDEAISHAASLGAEECFVIGGSFIYSLALPIANRLYRTIIDMEMDGDVFFPEFNESDWQLISRKYHPIDSRHAYSFEIQMLEKRR